MDIAPTIVELGGAAPAEGIDALRWDGRSLARVLREGRDPDRRQETVSELVDKRGGEPNFPSRMVRSGRWKLWKYGDKENLPPALFDLAEDPEEVNDLGEDPRYEDVRNRLLDRLHDGWDPRAAGREAAEGNRDHDVIAGWGASVLPSCEDTLASPPPGLEADVELL
jgi:arylsulfatase A-like enzyme